MVSPAPTPSLPAQDTGHFVTHTVTYKARSGQSAGHKNLRNKGLEAQGAGRVQEEGVVSLGGWRPVEGMVSQVVGRGEDISPPEVSPSALCSASSPNVNSSPWWGSTKRPFHQKQKQAVST